ncbi:hypothetical protein Elgi_68860 [Paenibacillus elgii]|nr:hypothetical protein Elgi_68860 [Paenibacillus elgii]
MKRSYNSFGTRCCRNGCQAKEQSGSDPSSDPYMKKLLCTLGFGP